MAKFKVVSKYKDKGIKLPKRATKKSAGYDLASAEDMTIPSLSRELAESLYKTYGAMYELDKIIRNGNISVRNEFYRQLNLYQTEMSNASLGLKPVLIPTGLSIELADDEFFQIQPRSSTGVKYLLMMASSLGIIDSDYIESDNEGHMYLCFVNLSPWDIQIKKGDKLAQGIIQKYVITEDDDTTESRNGGFGSTGK